MSGRYLWWLAALTMASMTSVACAPRAGDESGTSEADTAFASLQARGAAVMGVDQYTSSHSYETLPNGGRIALQRDTDDSAGTKRIRIHLEEIARAFKAGDLRNPLIVHDQEVPGAAVMAERKGTIEYVFSPLPRGGQIRITSRDPVAIAAIHRFLAFQRTEHRVVDTHGH